MGARAFSDTRHLAGVNLSGLLRFGGFDVPVSEIGPDGIRLVFCGSQERLEVVRSQFPQMGRPEGGMSFCFAASVLRDSKRKRAEAEAKRKANHRRAKELAQELYRCALASKALAVHEQECFEGVNAIQLEPTFLCFDKSAAQEFEACHFRVSGSDWLSPNFELTRL